MEKYIQPKFQRFRSLLAYTIAFALYQQTNAQNGNWTQVGTFSNNGNKGLAFNIAIDPTNSSILYAAATGGLFKSTNRGNTWQPMQSVYKLKGAFVSDIAIDPNNHDNMVIITGRYTSLNGNSRLTAGIYRSCDGGQNWVPVKTFENETSIIDLYDVEYNPNNSNQIAIATSKGLYYSDNGGYSFRAYEENKVFVNVQFGESIGTGIDFTCKIYASGEYVIEFQTNAQIATTRIPISTISTSLTVLNTEQRGISIYFHRNTNTLYAKVVSIVDLKRNLLPKPTLWKFANNLWTKISDLPETISANFSVNNAPNNCITVHPTNTNVIYIGGLTACKSTDGGITFTETSDYSPGGTRNGHADIKNLRIDPTNPDRVYMMCDGGVFRSENAGGNWASITSGMDIKTPGKMYCSPHDPNKIVIGNQDTYSDFIDLSQTNIWTNFARGDGSYCFIDFIGNIYASENSDTYKYTSNGTSLKPIGIIRGFAEDPNNPSIIYMAEGKTIKRTNDYAETFETNLVADFSSYSIENILKVKIAPSNSNYIYTSTASKPYDIPSHFAKMYKTTNGGGGLANWTEITPTNPNLVGNYPYPNVLSISDIAISYNDPNKIWVSFSGGGTFAIKIMYSPNGGVTWYDKSEGLDPAESVESMAVEKDNNETVYIGTRNGIYYRSKYDATWQSYSCNLPNLTVNNISVIEKDKSIRATLEGRGVWKSPLRSSPTVANYFLTSRVNIDNHWDNTYYWRDFFQATTKIEISYNQSIIPNFTLIAGERILLKPGFRTYGNNMKAIIKAPSINANCLAPAIIANCTPIGLFRVESGDSVNTSQSDTLQKAETYKNTINSNKKNDQDIKSTIKIAEYKITISPNPTTSKVHLTTGFDGENEIVLTDITGKTLQTFTTTSNETDIDLSAYSNGMYFFKITNRLGKHIAKVMKIVEN